MTQEFRVSGWARFLETARAAGYALLPGRALADGWPERPAILLRHDVDRRAGRALAMARREAALGVSASYYVRRARGGFDVEAIRAIAALGHEIGYHYEDLARTDGDRVRARAAMRRHLAELRALVPVTTVCAHGSPLSRHDNVTVLDGIDPADLGVRDLARSLPHAGVLYLTDSGRTFADTTANLRDRIPAALRAPEIATLADLADAVSACRYPRIHLNVHPERWTDEAAGWWLQRAQDAGVAIAKRGLGAIRRRRGVAQPPQC
ncbi:hypothetical protein ACTZWW_10520 [Salinarimonas sp. NSM]|uniref:hypothetical protein n=1 Tax=Salinarimonas sp. NSM TaxID=3458003 RepID=UPI0040368E0C